MTEVPALLVLVQFVKDEPAVENNSETNVQCSVLIVIVILLAVYGVNLQAVLSKYKYMNWNLNTAAFLIEDIGVILDHKHKAY